MGNAKSACFGGAFPCQKQSMLAQGDFLLGKAVCLLKAGSCLRLVYLYKICIW